LATGKRGVSPIWLQKSIPPTFYFGNMLELIVVTSEFFSSLLCGGLGPIFSKKEVLGIIPTILFVARMHNSPQQKNTG
jgi:hypothetical protein